MSCLVISLQQPEHIFWYHNGEVVSYYSSRGGISIIMRRGVEETITMSSLIIRQAGPEDQGTYTCRPETGDFKTARTRLFIGQGGGSGVRGCQVGRKIDLTTFSYLIFYLLVL